MLNLFDKGRSHRSVRLNSQYFGLFFNLRDKSQIDVIAWQMYPNKVKFLRESFEDATKQPYTYLLTTTQKKLIAKHRHLFQQVTTRQVSIKTKRKLLTQWGNGFSPIPISFTLFSRHFTVCSLASNIAAFLKLDISKRRIAQPTIVETDSTVKSGIAYCCFQSVKIIEIWGNCEFWNLEFYWDKWSPFWKWL